MQEALTPKLPYVALLEGRDPIEVLAATPGRVAALLASLTAEQAEHRPAPGKWNVREVMAHLADCEIAWSWRFRQIFAEDNPTMQPFDQDRWAGAYAGYSLGQAKAIWQPLRAWNLAFFGSLSETDMHRPATHPELGSLTLWDAARIAAGHDLHHLPRLQHAVEALKTIF